MNLGVRVDGMDLGLIFSTTRTLKQGIKVEFLNSFAAASNLIIAETLECFYHERHI